jgi:fimbrial chaperone protein
MSRIVVFVLLASAWLAVASPAAAQKVEPLIIDLSTSGPAAATTMRVSNTEDTQLAVEIVAEKRLVDENGVETREAADDDFIIVPPQLRVAPGQTANVRLRYVGDRALERSQGYVVTVKQVPLAELQVTGVQVLINFAASVHVAPPNAKGDLRITQAALAADADGKPVARFRIENQGSLYQGLATGKIDIKEPGGKSLTLAGDPLREAVKHTLLPAGGARNVTVALPADWPTSGPVEVAVTPSAPRS